MRAYTHTHTHRKTFLAAKLNSINESFQNEKKKKRKNEDSKFIR